MIFLFVGDLPSITEPPTDTTVNRGNGTTFTCSAIGNGTLNITWRLPSGEIVFTGQDMMEEWSVNSSLTIGDITADDGGIYVCIVLNEAGVTEARAVLYVSLYISGELIGLNTTSGSVENITCMIEGFPVSYHWEKMPGDDNMIVNYSIVSIGRTLQFNPVEFGDEGVYHCVGHSGMGDGLISDDVTVTSEPF